MLLQVDDLSIKVNLPHKNYYVLQNISFEIGRNSIVAFTGSSGSGKTISALSLLGLLPTSMQQTSGTITSDGINYGAFSNHPLSELRGSKIAMIFQEPQASLNPVIKVGRQICDVIKQHNVLPAEGVKNKALKILDEVGLPEPENLFNMYAHQLSGGMAQRILIALALSCNPQLLIADEPTTALDATTQVQIIRLLKELQGKRQFSILLISHDQQLVSTLADRVLLLENGKLIEKIWADIYE
jgi:ABC-type dipeptide/oligopeptide/nickel transport system ATPase component